MNSSLVEMRLKTRIHPDEMEAKVGKILQPGDLNVVLTGPAKVLKPNGDVLCIYLPGVLNDKLREASYPLLHEIRERTDNRGLASGSKRVQYNLANDQQSRAKPVMSSIVGYIEPQGGRHRICRTTAWTGRHTEEFRALYPLFQTVARLFSFYVPDRFKVQQGVADQSHPDWVIPQTPFSTVTVNNTYPTGVHQDVGDLPEGFSCLAVLRRGAYSGGVLTFPEYRIGADLHDGDVILMDAHEWHGNTEMHLESDDAERISVVLYFRTNVAKCGAPMDEIERAKRQAGKLENVGG